MEKIKQENEKQKQMLQ